MATYTPNYNLSKPESTDDYRDFITSYGDNMDKIDQNMGGGGGGGGHTIVDPNGTDMPQEDKLQFTGSVSVSDDAVNGQTVVDVEGGGNYYLNTLYSTEEKKIGYWTDGKPLYQICITGSYTGVWGTRTIASKSALNIDTFVKGEPNMHFTQSNNVWYNVGAYANVYINDDNIQLAQSFTNQSRNFTYNAVLQYTKTTDTPELNPQTGGVIYLPTIYSDEEREVGVWRDGKPLYQKTVNFGSLPANNGSKTVAHGISNLETLANAVFAVQSSTQFRTLPNVSRGNVANQTVWYITATDIGVLTGSNADVGSAYSGYVTIQYTKTTDVAGSGTWTPSGANAVHYSTNEQVIGTWINGKPIYEKTLNIGSLPNATAIGYTHNISNLDQFVDVKGIAVAPSKTAITIPWVNTSTPTDAVQMVLSSTSVIVTAGTDRSGFSGFITLRYTKTTD